MLKPLLVLLFLIVSPVSALAQDVTVRDRVIAILREDGFSEVRISRTLLGRMRFVAETDAQRREIVVNPITGVVLRDYVRFFSDDDGTAFPGPSGSTGSSGSGNGGSGGGFDDDDDEEDADDRDEDDGDDSDADYGSDDDDSGSDNDSDSDSDGGSDESDGSDGGDEDD